jgi:Flp pilus assembly protein TadD
MRTLQDPLLIAGDHVRAGQPDAAERVCRELVATNPWVADAWFILGVASQLQGKLEESVEQYRRSLSLVPYNAEAWNNLAASLLSLRRHEEAAPCVEQALALAPDYAEAHNNRGNLLQALGRHEEAIACYGRALELKPGYHAAYDHLGLVMHAQGRLPEAVRCYSRALELAPDYAVAHMNRALARLQMGEFAPGWAEYEWRFACPEHPLPGHDQPVWDGSPLDSRPILLWTEQGLGDSIQFVRYAPLIAARGGRVILHSPSSLARILSTCPGIHQLVIEGQDLPEFTCHAPLMSLPRILGTTLETIPAEVPYLRADPELVRRWSEALQAAGGLRVGIAWQGNPGHKKDLHRSFPLTRFRALAAIPGVRLFSLQKGAGSGQLRSACRDLPVIDLGPWLEDFMDTAAVLANLDLVICPDTSLAHLAAALGVPVWVALPFACDWRWLLHRDDTPWYPTLRLYRQSGWGDWDGVFARLAVDLARLATARR